MPSNRRVERLIKAARRKSHNTRFGTNEGIPDRLVLEYLNDGLRHIFSKFCEVGSELYTKEAFIDIVSGTAAYDFPDRLAFSGEFLSVQFSYNGNWTNDYFRNLNGPISEEEISIYPAVPRDWLIRGGQLVLSPIPDRTLTSGVRVVYREALPTLDIRRGVIHSGTSYTANTGVLSTLKIDPSATPFDSTSLILDEDWVNIVDADGNFLMRNIGQVTAIDTTTGVITFDSAFRGGATETAPAGAYLTSGWNATTHSPFDFAIDDYLIDYAALQMTDYDHDDVSYKKKSDKLKERERDLILHHGGMSFGRGFVGVPR